MRLMSVVGARPQFIKAAALSRVIRARNDIKGILVHTGQHYDANMSDIFFDELEIPRPDYSLGVGSATHGIQTGQMLERIEEVYLKEMPDWVLVYGDTNSTLAGALAAAKMPVPIAHVEAGLRSFNRGMPEEINRVLTDHAADLLLAPTETAVKNLRREGIPDTRVRLVGDVMYDVALYYGHKAERRSHILERLGLKRREYILATIHRAENTDAPTRLAAIFKGLCEVTRQLEVVIPLHPRTRSALIQANLYNEVAQCVCLIEPVGYLDMAMLEKNALLIATDSGGVQKEAYFYRVPCVTLREETEWVELVELGWNRIIRPTSKEAVAAGIHDNLRSTGGADGYPYGEGKTAEKILHLLESTSYNHPDEEAIPK